MRFDAKIQLCFREKKFVGVGLLIEFVLPVMSGGGQAMYDDNLQRQPMDDDNFRWENFTLS